MIKIYSLNPYFKVNNKNYFEPANFIDLLIVHPKRFASWFLRNYRLYLALMIYVLWHKKCKSRKQSFFITALWSSFQFIKINNLRRDNLDCFTRKKGKKFRLTMIVNSIFKWNSQLNLMIFLKLTSVFLLKQYKPDDQP